MSATSLEDAEIVVGVGTGLGRRENLKLARELAEVLGAAIAATRRVTDANWLPRQHQVGLTGKAIAPKLYLALGIRGVMNHTIGIQRAQTIVAINTDPEAPIFQVANYGVGRLSAPHPGAHAGAGRGEAASTGTIGKGAASGRPRWVVSARKEEPMSIITISRGSLSGGSALAERLADRLDIGASAAKRSSRWQPSMESLSPSSRKSSRRLQAFGNGSPNHAGSISFSSRRRCASWPSKETGLPRTGGPTTPEGISHIMKVRLIAPLEYRLKIAIERQGLASREAARQYLQQVDEERLRRMRYLFNVDWRDPASTMWCSISNT